MFLNNPCVIASPKPVPFLFGEKWFKDIGSLWVYAAAGVSNGD